MRLITGLVFTVDGCDGSGAQSRRARHQLILSQRLLAAAVCLCAEMYHLLHVADVLIIQGTLCRLGCSVELTLSMAISMASGPVPAKPLGFSAGEELRCMNHVTLLTIHAGTCLCAACRASPSFPEASVQAPAKQLNSSAIIGSICFEHNSKELFKRRLWLAVAVAGAGACCRCASSACAAASSARTAPASSLVPLDRASGLVGSHAVAARAPAAAAAASAASARACCACS